MGARAAELAHDELEEEKRRFARLLVFRKVGEDAALFFAAEGRIRQNNVPAISIADFFERYAQAIERIDLRCFQTMQEEIHVREQVGKRFGFASEEALGLEDIVVLGSLALLLQMIEGCDEESTSAAGWIEERFAQAWIGDGNHVSGVN